MRCDKYYTFILEKHKQEPAIDAEKKRNINTIEIYTLGFGVGKHFQYLKYKIISQNYF